MAIEKTDKHELEYDTVTKQGLFNGGRNKTAAAPSHNPFPARFIKVMPSAEVEEEVEETVTLADNPVEPNDSNDITDPELPDTDGEKGPTRGLEVVENDNKNVEPFPVRIAKLVTKELVYMSEPTNEDIEIVVEFDNDTLELVHPTSFRCEMSVLGDTTIELHYYGVTKHDTVKIIAPKSEDK